MFCTLLCVHQKFNSFHAKLDLKAAAVNNLDIVNFRESKSLMTEYIKAVPINTSTKFHLIIPRVHYYELLIIHNYSLAISIHFMHGVASNISCF